MAGQAQVPVTFEDVAVYLSRAEWEAITEEQQELYCSVMLDVYELLTSLGHTSPKPDILYRLEHREEPWVFTSQSPMKWDRPDSPSPGHDSVLSCLEEPASGWWPGTGRSHTPEEMAQIPYQGGRCVPWRLHLSQLLRKFKCLEGGGKLTEKVAGTRVGPVESPNQASKPLLLGNETAAEIMSDITQSRTFPLHLEVEQQNRGADPQDHLSASSTEHCQNTQGTMGKVTFFQGNRELSLEEMESIFEDHCYSLVSKTKLLPRTLQEHSYCMSELSDACGPGDHGYCHGTCIHYPGRIDKTVPSPSKAQAKLDRLAKRCCQVQRIISKARWVPWLCRPCTSTKCPLRKGSTATSCFRLIPSAEAKSNPLEGPFRMYCPPEQLEAVSPQSQHQSESQAVTSEALHSPVVAFELPSSNMCWRSCGCVHNKVQKVQPILMQDMEGCGFATSNSVSAQGAYKTVLQNINHVLGSECQNFGCNGCLQPKDIRVIKV